MNKVKISKQCFSKMRNSSILSTSNNNKGISFSFANEKPTGKSKQAAPKEVVPEKEGEVETLSNRFKKFTGDLEKLIPKNASFNDFNKAILENPRLKTGFEELREMFLLNSTKNQHVVQTKPPVRIAVTGASGQIGYSLLFRIASGEMLGAYQPVILQLLELPVAMKSLEGVVMELRDCAFPLLAGIETTDNPEKAFEGADYALLVGAKPRSKGMERADLLKENGKIFEVQGRAINKTANKNIKVLVVGNPANTNAMITSHFAPDISPNNIHAMTKLDHNRGLAQLAQKMNCSVTEIERFCIWGNHSATQYPDISHVLVKGKWIKDSLDKKWVESEFIPTVQQRGAAIINARGVSSAASAASSAIDHMREWVMGTSGWTSMAIPSDGSYNIDKGIWYSFPVIVSGSGKVDIVQNVPIDEFSAKRMEATRLELLQERAAVEHLLK